MNDETGKVALTGLVCGEFGICVEGSSMIRAVSEEKIKWKRYENELRQTLTHPAAPFSENVLRG